MHVQVFNRYSILAGDVCFVNLFRSVLLVVPTECDVLIVNRQHNDSVEGLRNSMQKCGKM